MRVRPVRSAVVAMLLTVPLALLSPGAATASNREPIDPLTLNPPLVHGEPSCAWRGEHIVCESTVPQESDYGTFPSGIVCDGIELDWSIPSAVLEKGIAVYNADKDIVRLTYIDSYTGSFTNPETGTTARWTQKDTTVYDVTTPGDNTSGTSTMRAIQKIYAPDGRLIIVDTGIETFTLPDYTRIRSLGTHPIDDYFYGGGDADGLVPLCDALT